MNLSISPHRAGRILAFVILLFTTLSVSGQVLRFEFFDRHATWYIALFDLNRELNIPTFYQGITLLAAGLLLALIACHAHRLGDRFRWRWTALAGVFLVLSADELCQLHDQCSQLMEKHGYVLHGLAYYVWVIPGFVAVVALGALFLPLVMGLPSSTRARFVRAGAIYLAGALGVEMIGGRYDDIHGGSNLTYQLIANFEELLEMTGVAMFIIALLDYIALHLPRINVSVQYEPQISVVQLDACQPDSKPSRPISQHSGLMPS